MHENEWAVTLSSGHDIHVRADGWHITGNGDLMFVNHTYDQESFYLRAFAAGTWKEVSFSA